MIGCWIVWQCVWLGVIPPLTENQLAQLQTAQDATSRFDGPALYPLLKNALLWEVGDESGAVIPDYEAIFQKPAEHRGRLFLIEGLFGGVPGGAGGRSLKIGLLARAGGWEKRLEQWVIVTDRERDRVAVVYLVDPPSREDQPLRAGARVRLAARFYKVLSDTDLAGRPTDYLTFVGHGAVVTGGGSGTGGGIGEVGPPLIVVLLVLVGGWFVLRRVVRLGVRPTRAGVDRGGGRGAGDRGWEDGPDARRAEALPTDPAEALDVLRNRQDER